MPGFRPVAWTIACISTLSLVALALQSPVSARQNPAEKGGAEDLTRGPVHEAFGKPITFNPKPGLKIAKEPPAPVEELPPDEKPEGDNVAWVPGYWSYDEERTDFIWISGFWRTLPPDRTWAAGYWKKEADGHVWVSGYWASAATKDTEYHAAPPESLENGASTKAPSQDHIWVPGCWVWHDAHYVWRPGYWLVNQSGWIWVPSHYNWTPCGYVYVDGYWDWSVRRRGVLFAPVYISSAYYTRPGYVYSPTIVIDGDVVTEHFFVRPAYGHYYFGDYYAANYVSVGITPWFTFHTTRYSYDPIYCYYECHYRRADPGWSARIQVDYRYRVDNVDARPPRTYVQQQVVVNNVTKTKIVNNTTIINNNNNTTNNNKSVAIGRSLKEVSQDKDAPTKFQKVEPEKRKQITQEAKEVRQATAQRTQLESDAAKNAPQGANAQPLRLARPPSPVVAKADNNNGNDKDKAKNAPPPLPPTAKQDRDKIAQSNNNNNRDNKNDKDKNDGKNARGGNDVAGGKNNDAAKMDKDKAKDAAGGGNANKPPTGNNPPKTPPKTPPKSDKDKDKDKDKKKDK